MKRAVKYGVLGVAVIATVGVGATALARGAHEWHHGMFKAKVTEHIDSALDAAKVTAPQREAIHAARDHVFATVEETQRGRGARMAQAVALFESDKVDPAAVAALRGEHQAEARKIGDAVVQAITDAHDALTAEQRKAMVEYVREHKPHMGHGGEHAAGGFLKHMASQRIDAALDAAKVDEAQRATIHAARDRVFAAFEAGHQNPGARIEEALALFGEDKLDQARIATLRAEHEAVAAKTAAVIEQAVIEAHDVLTPEQRRAVVEFVHAHHGELRGSEAHGG